MPRFSDAVGLGWGSGIIIEHLLGDSDDRVWEPTFYTDLKLCVSDLKCLSARLSSFCPLCARWGLWPDPRLLTGVRAESQPGNFMSSVPRPMASTQEVLFNCFPDDCEKRSFRVSNPHSAAYQLGRSRSEALWHAPLLLVMLAIPRASLFHLGELQNVLDDGLPFSSRERDT